MILQVRVPDRSFGRRTEPKERSICVDYVTGTQDRFKNAVSLSANFGAQSFYAYPDSALHYFRVRRPDMFEQFARPEGLFGMTHHKFEQPVFFSRQVHPLTTDGYYPFFRIKCDIANAQALESA